jgi:exopolysaccharide biosynthesis polyprenyl glycosylphosphotransferase
MSEANTYSKTKPWQLSLNERKVLLIFGDLLMSFFALVLSLYWWDQSMPYIDLNLDYMQKRGYIWFYLLPLLWLIFLIDIQDPHRAMDWKRVVRVILAAAILGLGIYAVIFVYNAGKPETFLPRLSVAIFLALVSFLTLGWRLIYIWIFSSQNFLRRVLVVGAGRSGQALISVIQGLQPQPFVLVGLIDDDLNKAGTSFNGIRVLGTNQDLVNIIQENDVSELIVAITGKMSEEMFRSLLEVQEKGVLITRMPVAYEELVGRVPINLLEADWILRAFVDKARINLFFETIKRLMDILGGIVGTLFLILFFPIIGLAIFIDSGRPIFYWQVRSGRGGVPYKIIKFRTMRTDAEADGKPKWAKEDDERATRVGKILRKTHLDELPQFINVLKGDMSLVGPRAERPELVAYFEQYVPFYRARLLVRPGITGWAQVNFGYASTIEETSLKLEYDLYYILHRSLMMDLVVLVRTPTMVLGFRGR